MIVVYLKEGSVIELPEGQSVATSGKALGALGVGSNHLEGESLVVTASDESTVAAFAVSEVAGWTRCANAIAPSERRSLAPDAHIVTEMSEGPHLAASAG